MSHRVNNVGAKEKHIAFFGGENLVVDAYVVFSCHNVDKLNGGMDVRLCVFTVR